MRRDKSSSARPPRPDRPRRQIGPPAGEIRLIGGTWRRTRLPVADRPGLRPTPDRVRETLFNWLGQDLTGWRVLDAFAGSGALGFEAASRGAAEVQLIERDPALIESLRTLRVRLKADMLRIERSDALRWMASAAPGRYELVLLDPPFEAGVGAAAAALAAPLVVPGGYLYVEGPDPLEAAPVGFVVHRTLRAGAVQVQLFLRADAPDYTEGEEDDNVRARLDVQPASTMPDDEAEAPAPAGGDAP